MLWVGAAIGLILIAAVAVLGLRRRDVKRAVVPRRSA
jgi:hypothetical protein